MGWQQPGLVGRAMVGTAMVVGVMVIAGCARVAPSQLDTSAPGVTASSTQASDAGASGSGSAVSTSAVAAASPAASAASAASSAASGSSPSGTPGPATRLSLTSALTRDILTTAAAFNRLPVTAYSGLMPGRTYVALDAAGDTWVGTALEPSSTSIPAQVSVQDNGSYLLLRKSSGSSSWTVYAVGLASPKDCAAVGLPAAVSSLWGWAPTACRPGPGA